MSKKIWLLLLLISSVLQAAEPSAEQIMVNNYNVGRIENITAQLVLQTFNGNSTKINEMRSWSKLKENGKDSMALTQFIKPLDIQNSSFLMLQNGKKDTDMWVYLPALGKSRRITSTSKKSSFFGTDFSYADIELVNPEKFNHILLKAEKSHYIVESVINKPSTKEELGYNKKISWINATTFLEEKIEYYVDKNLIKTQVITIPTNIDSKNNKWIGLQRVMTNNKTGSKTMYRMISYDTNKPIAASKFTINAMENLR